MGTANADVARRLTEKVFLGGDLQAIDELLAEDFVSHDMPGGRPGTRDGFRDLARMVVGAFSERRMEFDEYIDTADGRVVERWATLGRHTGAAFGLPPSGQTVRARGIDILRFADGKVVEHWGTIDMSDLFEKVQTGAPGS